jgi:hypothetical protein
MFAGMVNAVRDEFGEDAFSHAVATLQRSLLDSDEGNPETPSFLVWSSPRVPPLRPAATSRKGSRVGSERLSPEVSPGDDLRTVDMPSDLERTTGFEPATPTLAIARRRLMRLRRSQ